MAIVEQIVLEKILRVKIRRMNDPLKVRNDEKNNRFLTEILKKKHKNPPI